MERENIAGRMPAYAKKKKKRLMEMGDQVKGDYCHFKSVKGEEAS